MGENIYLTKSNAAPSKVCQCGIQISKKSEEIRALKKTLSEKELINHMLESDCFALRGKLAAVEELDCSDQTSRNVEQAAAMQEMHRQIEVLQGLLSIKEVNEKDFVDKISELEKKLELTMESTHQLKVQHAALQKITLEKEEVELRLQERYTQVEELERLNARREEEHKEHLGMLLSEITEREHAFLNLEKANLMLVRQMGEMEKNIHYLDEKMGHLKRELENRVFSEAKIRKQCLEMEKAVKDWQLLDQRQKEQFEQLEHKLQCTIIQQKTQLAEKDESLRGHLKFLVHTKKFKDTQPDLHLKFSEESPPHKEQCTLYMDMNQIQVPNAVLSSDINTPNGDVKELQEQIRLYKGVQKELEDRNLMREHLLIKCQGENRALQEKITQVDGLLSIKTEAEHSLQMQIHNLEHLLKEKKETQERLSECHAELDSKQHDLCDELKQWKRECSNYEKQEKEMNCEIQQLKGLVNRMEQEACQLRLTVSQKENELRECHTLNKKGMSYLTLDYNRAVVQLQKKMSSLQQENEKMNVNLQNNSKKLETSGENVRNVIRELEEKQQSLKQIENALQMSAKGIEAHLHEKVLFVKVMETKLLEQAQLSGDSDVAEMQQNGAVVHSMPEQKVNSMQNNGNMEEVGFSLQFSLFTFSNRPFQISKTTALFFSFYLSHWDSQHAKMATSQDTMHCIDCP